MALTQISTNGIKDANVNTADIADGAVTEAKLGAASVVTAKINDSAVTSLKLGNNSVTEPRIASNAVTTAKIADEAVTLAKLEHGTSSNDGKFLRANNGADPTFETVTGTTINTNGDNRVLTGTGTANTIQGESQLLFDSNGLLYIKAPDGGNRYFFGETGNSQSAQLSLYNSSDQQKVRIASGDGASEASTFFNGGKVGIGTSNPPAAFHIHYGTDPSLNLFSTQHTQNTGSKINFGVGESASASGNTGCRIEHNIPNSGGQMSGELKFYTNNGDSLQERVRIQAAGGISFNGDSAAANALDDYEEGSWTPAVSGGSGTSHGEQYGRYTKIGRLVVVSARIQFSCNGTSGNQLSVGGLPFQSASGTGENYTSGGITYCNLTLDANRFHPYVGDASNTVYFYEMNSGAGVNIGGSFSNKYLGFSAHYFT